MNISVAPAVEYALDLLFPAHSVHCGAGGELLSELCILSLTPYPGASCSKCSELTHGPDPCDRCAADPPALTRMIAGYLFDDIARDAVHGLKYKDIRALVPILGSLLSESLIGLRRTPDVIVPVPLHSGRMRERGFNQAEALANRVGELLGGRSIPAFSGAESTSRIRPVSDAKAAKGTSWQRSRRIRSETTYTSCSSTM